VLQKPLHQAKSRLQPFLTPEERMELTWAMLYDVLSALAQATFMEYLVVFTQDQKVMELARWFGAHVIHEPAVQGMNAATRYLWDSILCEKLELLMILPSDIPLITGDEVDLLLQESRNVEMMIVPCKQGTGTNGLVLSPPRRIGTRFGACSRAKHEKMAERQGMRYGIHYSGPFAHDIDTMEDLRVLKHMGNHTRTYKFLAEHGIFGRIPCAILQNHDEDRIRPHLECKERLV
jgi:2-phospho-L-lactate guanylyltransferase